MSGQLPKLEGRITVPTGGWSVSVNEGGGAQTVTVAAGNYYLTSSTSLLTAFATALDAHASLAGDYTVTISDNDSSATGKVTIACTQSFSLSWTSADLQTALGFGSSISSQTTQTGEYSSPYIWLPNVYRTNPMAPDPSPSTLLSFGGEDIDATFSMSPSGSVKALAYTRRFRENLEWAHLTGAKTWEQFESNANESAQRFWQNVTSTGRPFRYHMSRDEEGSNDYYELVMDPRGGFHPTPMTPGFVGSAATWGLVMPCYKNA